MKPTTHSWKLFVDGASRGNPGPSGAGLVITNNDELIFKKGLYLGKRTNNQAEYLALALGLLYVLKLLKKYAFSIPELTIISDSELMIKQMKAMYKVKNPDLFILKTSIDQIRKPLLCNFKHVLRAHNTEADEMANEGIDKKKAIPQTCKKQLELFGISL